jgi:hypothetical protein
MEIDEEEEAPPSHPLAFLTTQFLEGALLEDRAAHFERVLARLRALPFIAVDAHPTHGHWIEWTPIEFVLIEGKTEERRRADAYAQRTLRLHAEHRHAVAAAEASSSSSSIVGIGGGGVTPRALLLRTAHARHRAALPALEAEGEANLEALRQRTAALILCLHTHCGIPVRRGPHSVCVRSVLGLAMRYENLPAFEVLLVRCGAVFDATEAPLGIMYELDTANAILPFLQLLAQHRARLPALPSLDPNERDPDWDDQTALQRTVCYRTWNHAQNPDPELVRVLVFGFGADATLLDQEGRTALDLLRQVAGWKAPRDFVSQASYEAWQARVAITDALLCTAMAQAQRLDHERRMTAVLMGVDSLRLGADSPLRHLDTGMARMVLDQL